MFHRMSGKVVDSLLRMLRGDKVTLVPPAGGSKDMVILTLARFVTLGDERFPGFTG